MGENIKLLRSLHHIFKVTCRRDGLDISYLDKLISFEK